ncbi:MAG TPA: hypothetical protein VHK88_01810, partial [Aquihabitans sp.]|nr:hypothetical protein [Aquihabitans sp.]
LERSGLVTSRKEGRVRTYRLAPEPLAEAERWVQDQRRLWERRLDQLDDHLRHLHHLDDLDDLDDQQEQHP